ncbi:hypothetical protein GJAV_G00159660 [Gymnothorax javanicus]|nr:hypothetical protein GJAV_G00159660 [Gymnothorax javanicus]
MKASRLAEMLVVKICNKDTCSALAISKSWHSYKTYWQCQSIDAHAPALTSSLPSSHWTGDLVPCVFNPVQRLILSETLWGNPLALAASPQDSILRRESVWRWRVGWAQHRHTFS